MEIIVFWRFLLFYKRSRIFRNYFSLAGGIMRMFSPTFLSQGATSCRGKQKPKQYSHHAIEYLVLSFLKNNNNNNNNLALLSFLLLTGVIAQGSSPTGSRKEIITAACLVCGLSCLCLELIATHRSFRSSARLVYRLVCLSSGFAVSARAKPTCFSRQRR